MSKQNKPPIQASEAWQEMQRLLDSEMPVSNKNNGNKKITSILLLLLLIGGCGIYKFLYNGESGSYKIATTVANDKTIPTSTKREQSNLQPTYPTDVLNKLESTKNTISLDQNSTLPSTKNGQNDSRKTNLITKTTFNNNEPKKNPAGKELMQASTTQAFAKATNKLSSKGNKFEKSLEDIATNKSVATNKLSTKENEFKGILANKVNKNIEPTTVKNTSVVVKDTTSTNLGIKQNKELAKSSNAKAKAQKDKKKWQVGIEWNLPVSFNNKSLFAEVNAKNNPFLTLIPTVWISKTLSKKSSVQFSVNPYSQVLLNSRSRLRSGNYSVGSVSASNIGQGNSVVSLAQNFALYKVIGLQAAIQYQYHLSEKWMAGIEIGNTWTRNALINETLLKNKTEMLKDSLYGVIKTDADWQYISRTFISGKLSLAYKVKRCEIGASIMRPLTNIYQSENLVQPINTQVFVRYRIW